MDAEEREILRMTEAQLAETGVASICYNLCFARMICPEKRILARYPFSYTPGTRQDLQRLRREMAKIGQNRFSRAIVFAVSLSEKDEESRDDILAELASEQVTVIDARGIPPEEDSLRRHARGMVLFNLARARHDAQQDVYREQAYEALRPWTEKLLASPVRIYGAGQEGVSCSSLARFYEERMEEIRHLYPYSPDNLDLDGWFYESLGARYRVREGFEAQTGSRWEPENPEKTPEKLFSFVWGNDSGWDQPEWEREGIVILKKTFDTFLETRLEEAGRLSFAEVFEFLREAPYGLLPNRIGAILMGMFFRTWRNRGLRWSNGFQEDDLDDDRIVTMIENGIHNQRTWYRNSLTDYIMMPSGRAAAFTGAAAEIFDLPPESTRFLSGLRTGMRLAMEKLPYPAAAAARGLENEADRETMERMIRFVRLTSDDAREAEDDLTAVLDEAFRTDPELKARIRRALSPEMLEKGFERMMKEMGAMTENLSPETLDRMCGGHREWKWIWREETIVSRIRALGYS